MSIVNLETRPSAVITGGSRGLGRALARTLAQKGWNLVLTARNATALHSLATELRQAAPEIQVHPLVGDVTDAAHRQEILKTVRQLGALKAVVNNASRLGPSPQPELLDYPLAALQQVYATNLLAPLALLQTLQGELGPDSRILNLSSDAA